MPKVRQRVDINWGFGTPKLKGRLFIKPVVLLPVKNAVKDPIDTNVPVYIKPLELKPFVPETIEPPLNPLISDIIPEYIGGLDESEQEVHKRDAESTPTTEDETDTERPLTA